MGVVADSGCEEVAGVEGAGMMGWLLCFWGCGGLVVVCRGRVLKGSFRS